ncbi:MAG: ATP-binding protein [Pseudohongiellaceae bacterium]
MSGPVRVSRRYSLQHRFLLAFTLTLALFLGLTGVVLDRAFRDSVEAGVAEQLQVQIYVLLAAFEEEQGRFYLGAGIREPRFAQLNSGLYGLVTDRDGEVLRTASALDQRLPADVVPDDLQRGEFRFRQLTLDDGQPFFVSHYTVMWENRSTPFVFSVFESTDTYLAEVNSFRASLWSWLGGAALVLLVAQLLLLRWGLAPLRRLAWDIKGIESGDSEALSGDYPQELEAVTDNFNVLISAERKQQARYRTTLGDLAHSLKTPLAVLRAGLDQLQQDGEDGVATQEQLMSMDEQVERMNQIVRYQLQRAVRSEQGTALLARRVNVSDVVRRVTSALEKVYAGQGVRIQCSLDHEVRFPGDERDLMEVVGNVMDNACKYGAGEVHVTARRSDSPGHPLCIVIEDNGPGIPTGNRNRVLSRGARLDTLPRGQGIGLAVVADIVASYGGQIDVDDSELGGARIELVFASAGSAA